MIYITSKREGFARCGVRFSETTASYPDDRFTPEQLADLESEPMLIVSRDAGMTAGQAAEQISRLKNALDAAEHEVAVVTAERDVLHQQLADMTAERDALREQLTAASPAPAPAEDGVGVDTDGADADAAPKPARTGAKKK
ncbi:hypothetical protein DNY73_17770 [Salmonella enterica subsp. diarizonae]|nr:hypothetical protein [Salmonella enterica subsp. diarizonae]EAS0615693.1 hypothetical protein [Salmonella enterica subsp. enterica serovar Dahomey]ECG0109118.1 hypothetical protein [Salmonella enterica]EFO5310617.1 hypothetical protein [Salmonella enterica]EFO8057757.1 hypothetical protein [Salmonella enterica]